MDLRRTYCNPALAEPKARIFAFAERIGDDLPEETSFSLYSEENELRLELGTVSLEEEGVPRIKRLSAAAAACSSAVYFLGENALPLVEPRDPPIGEFIFVDPREALATAGSMSECSGMVSKRLEDSRDKGGGNEITSLS